MKRSILAIAVFRPIRYDYQADVWSLGVILYICLFRMIPFGDDDEEANDNADLSYYGSLTFLVRLQTPKRLAAPRIRKMTQACSLQ